MFELSEYSSLTWDSAAWIYSVIIGVVLVRYFMFIANLLQEPKAIKFYYPYLALCHHIFFICMEIGTQAYTMIEGHTLSFALRTFMDAVACISALIIVPQDKLLEGFFDMKSWFMKIKRAYFFIVVLYFLVLEMYIVLSFIYTPEMMTTENLIGAFVFIAIMILLYVASAFSKNDYYLSFHGTLMVVMFSFFLSQL